MLKLLGRRKKSKGQSTMEYAVLIIIVIGCLMAMQLYAKRAFQQRIKDEADNIGGGGLFSVGNTNSITTRTVSGRDMQTFQDGVSTTKLLRNELTRTQVSANIINVDQEFWGKSAP
jgi:hypothetical protein